MLGAPELHVRCGMRPLTPVWLRLLQTHQRDTGRRRLSITFHRSGSLGRLGWKIMALDVGVMSLSPRGAYRRLKHKIF